MSNKLLFTITAAVLLAAPALAHDYKIGSLQIGHPWARATPKGAPVGGGYLTITNNGTEPDRLVGGTAPFAKDVELHKMSMDAGVMKMRPVAGGLEIKPGETVTLKPGGLHLMFVGLDKPLKEGERVPATLDFTKAGKVKVDFVVEGMGATHEKGPSVAMPGMTGQHGH